MLYWCDTCVNVVCGHCVVINGEHKDHTIRTVAAKHAELRSHAATLTPRIATLAQQLKDETALTEALHTQTQAKLNTLSATAEQYSSQARAPLSALAKQLRLFLSQRTKQELEVLARTQNTLASMTGATDAPSITRLGRLLVSRPVWPFTSATASASVNADLDGSEPNEQAITNTLADTPWAAARAAFEAATTDATAGLVPREVTCEADVPLADLLSASNGDGFVAQLGTVELCGVRFMCTVRRGCGCGASSLLLSQQAQLQDTKDGAVVGASVEGTPSSANADAGSSLTGSATALPLCQCALVGEVTATIVSTSLAASYDACGARAKAVTELIETDDIDGIDHDNKASDSGKHITATADSVDCGDVVSGNTCEFGTVRASFTVLRGIDGKSSGGAQSDDNNTDNSGLVAAMLLTDINKRTAAVVLAHLADAQAVVTASMGAKWCVRVAVAFPDVFHEKRALHMLSEAVPVDWMLRTESAAAEAAAVAAAVAAEKAEGAAKAAVAAAKAEAATKAAVAAAKAAAEAAARAAADAAAKTAAEAAKMAAAKVAAEKAAAEAAAKAAAEAAENAAAEAAAKAAAEAEAANFAKWQTIPQSNDWEAAFDLHIACSLEECGYPRRQAKVASHSYTPSSAPVRDHGVPTPAALTQLQSKARDRILAYARQQLGNGLMTSDVVMYVSLCDANNTGYGAHYMVIRLDDYRLRHNAAHFRTAAQSWALGRVLHQCFVPSGQSPDTRLPFVSLHYVQHGPSCAKSPITLPETDIVYGEYTAPAASANVTYPVGTVLMYPREVVPREKTCGFGTYDSPWFIVFKPCAATLLRGAVPVGRVMSFVKGGTASTSDNSAQPFDVNVLQCFETYASPQTGQQCKSNTSYMQYS